MSGFTVGAGVAASINEISNISAFPPTADAQPGVAGEVAEGSTNCPKGGVTPEISSGCAPILWTIAARR
jgi:hypothetical protein